MKWPAGQRRLWQAAVAALAVGLAATPLRAQVPGDVSPRQSIRDRYKQPQNSQKLEESIRKLSSEELDDRLTALKTLGELKDDAKARQYLLSAASDGDMRVRV